MRPERPQFFATWPNSVEFGMLRESLDEVGAGKSD